MLRITLEVIGNNVSLGGTVIKHDHIPLFLKKGDSLMTPTQSHCIIHCHINLKPQDEQTKPAITKLQA
jgi:hypothetical protein